MTPRDHKVMVRLNAKEIARLDELRGTQRRAVFLRRLLQEPPRQDEVATRSEALALLSGLARDGSPTAAIALARELRSDTGEADAWKAFGVPRRSES